MSRGGGRGAGVLDVVLPSGANDLPGGRVCPGVDGGGRRKLSEKMDKGNIFFIH